MDESNIDEIYVDLQIYGNPLYEGQTYRLRYKFPPGYPVEVPWVQFVDAKAGLIVDSELQSSLRAQAANRANSGIPKYIGSSDPKLGTSAANSISATGIPIHPHVYGNGHICLDLLGEGWSPIHTIVSVALSLQSVLAGNDKNERPPDNNDYVVRAPQNPAKTAFAYHDNSV